MLRLVAHDRALQIENEPVVLGRDASADVVVDDRSVSRRHARLSRTNGTWVVEDLGSGNGTWIDGQRVSTAPVASGQELRLGTLGFRVEILGEEAPATMLVPALASVPAAAASYPNPAPPMPPVPSAADPYGAHAYGAQQYAAPVPDPYARTSSGGNGLWKVLGVLLVGYLAYDHFAGGKKQEEASAPARQAPARQEPAGPTSGLRIASIDVEKTPADGGATTVLIRTMVEGFRARQAQGGYQVSLVQDVETVLPDGSRIDALSKDGVNVLEQVMDSDEGLNAKLDFSFTAPAGAQGTLITRTVIRDRVGGGQVKGEAKVQLP